jgi:hypothetical protein
MLKNRRFLQLAFYLFSAIRLKPVIVCSTAGRIQVWNTGEGSGK